MFESAGGGLDMSRIDLSTRDLFLRLGATPRSRSARADKLFRRLRAEESAGLIDGLLKAPARPVGASPSRAKIEDQDD